jgi:hypothetical protein
MPHMRKGFSAQFILKLVHRTTRTLHTRGLISAQRLLHSQNIEQGVTTETMARERMSFIIL